MCKLVNPVYDAKNVHESSCNFGFSKVIHYIPDALTRQEEGKCRIKGTGKVRLGLTWHSLGAVP